MEHLSYTCRPDKELVSSFYQDDQRNHQRLWLYMCCYAGGRYPFNNFLHHDVEGIIVSCLESKNATLVDHLFRECSLVGKILQADRHPIVSSDSTLVS